jgi:hypothetical protein
MGERRLLILIMSFLVVIFGCMPAWKEERQAK